VIERPDVLNRLSGFHRPKPFETLGFNGLDWVRQFSVAIAQARSGTQQKQLIAQLLGIIAQDQVPDRPGRRDPRAVKRRPKPYQLLKPPCRHPPGARGA